MSSTSSATPVARAPAARVAAALLAVYLIWGSTYLGIRVVVTSGLPPLVSMGVRFLIAGLLLAGVLVARHGAGVLRLERRQVAGAGLIGVLLLLGGNGLVAIAETTVPSGLAALLVATTPVWLVVLGSVTGSRPRALTWIGTAIGFAGTAVLADPRAAQGRFAWWGVALVLVATLSWASGSLLSSRVRTPADVFVSAAVQMVVAGFLMTLVGVAVGETRSLDLAAVSARGWWALAYLVTFGSLVAYTAYFWLLRNAPIGLVSTYAYVNPVVAVALGWALLDEAITASVVLGGAIALLGVGLVVTSEHRPADRRRQADHRRRREAADRQVSRAGGRWGSAAGWRPARRR